MVRSSYIFGLLFAIYLLFYIEYNKAATFKLTNVVCETYNKSWYVIHNCRLKAVKRDKIVFNYNATLLYPTNNITVHGQSFQKANGYKPWLYNMTLDLCRFLRRPYHPAFLIAFNLIRPYSNFNHTCPYVGPQIVDGFYLRPELLHLPVPTGDYLVALTFYFHLRPQFSAKFYVQFVEDLI